MRKDILWYEMARRKIQFHANEKWSDIKLWGLFNWGSARPYLEKGLLRTDMRKENKIIWVWPSENAYERYIAPILSKYEAGEISLEEIIRQAR